MNRKAVAAVASVAVIGVVIAVIALSLVPIPDFPALTAGTYEGSIAFVDDGNCIMIADLDQATVEELRCEPEQGWIDEIGWSEAGIEMTAYLNQPTTRVLDPATGEIVDTRTGDEVASVPPGHIEGLLVDHPAEREIAIYDEQDRELLRMDAAERYWIDIAIPSRNGDLVAFADSLGRLAVFDREEGEPMLVAENVRNWPYPAWAP